MAGWIHWTGGSGLPGNSIKVTANLTIKQESFCLAYIETGNASEAYRLSYNTAKMKPTTINRNAFALLADSKIAARLDKLRSEHRERHDVTVDSITDEYEKARKLGMDNGQVSAAVAAITGKAKIHGLMVDRKQHSGKDGKPLNPPQIVVISAQMTPQEASEAYADTLNHE
jgi:phage terminase small subunit